MSDRIRPQYRIRLNIRRPDPAAYAPFKDFPTAAISDVFHKRQTLPPDVKPLYPECPRVVGPAITVLATPGDELLALKAIEVAQAGDVIVIAGARSDRFSLWGGIMSTMAKARGVAALVTDAMVRDLEETRAVAFPIWCTGLTCRAPVMDVPPGELNLPLPFGEVLIYPGDVVVADQDGVVVVPKGELAVVAEAVWARLAKEEAWRAEIARTRAMILKDTVDALLARRTVEYLPDEE